MPRFRLLWIAALLFGCAQAPQPQEARSPEGSPAALGPLPATYVNNPGCPGCRAVSLTLRPDGSYLLRDRIGAAEFYDFGRWRLAGGTLELSGGRDASRRHALDELHRAAEVEPLRGPFRLVGLYDGLRFRDCLTGLSWSLAESRAAETLKQEFLRQPAGPLLVALDARIEGAPETLLVQRPATLLNERACPG